MSILEPILEPVLRGIFDAAPALGKNNIDVDVER